MDKQAEQMLAHDRKAKLQQWMVGDRVRVRNYRESLNWIPAVIVVVSGPVTYMVESDKGYMWRDTPTRSRTS